jgi:hypothetical protein
LEKQFSTIDFEKLFHFIGYGSLDAEYWFLGMEEGGGGENNLRARMNFNPVMDCANAHKILGITKYHQGRKIIQSTWRGMCCIMLALEGNQVNTDNIREYQANQLGRSNGKTLLCELMPIPKPNLGDWDYYELLPQFSSRDEYYKDIMPKRIEYLRSVIFKNKPKFVICYGKKYWEEFKEVFNNIPFSKIDRFEITKNVSTYVLLTDHFSARSMNGKFESIASIIGNYLNQ